MHIITPNFLILSIMLVGLVNLISTLISFARNFLVLINSLFFFSNILIIDWLFFSGIRADLHMFSFGKYSIDFHLEATGVIFLNLLGCLWPCALMYTIKYLELNKMQNQSRFLFFLNLSVLSGIFIALSANLFTMFIFYEVLTLSTIPLIIHQQGKGVKEGAHQYLKILMISGLVLFSSAIIIIYSKVGKGDFVYRGFIANYFSINQTIILFIMFIFGISKAALYPLHKWLPVAMVASYPVSALLHAVVVVKAGLFCIYKVVICVFGIEYLHSIFAGFNWILLFPIITIFYCSIKALKIDNIKMILAYSTINQLSIGLMSCFMFTQKALAAAIIHMISHSLSKICLFYAAGNMYSLKKTVKLNDLIGINKSLPLTSAIFLIATLSIIGLPPFGGFVSKFYIMLAASQQSQFLVMIMIALSTILSALYMLKILIYIYKPSINKPVQIENKLPFMMVVSLILCTTGVVMFFVISKFINKFLVYIV